MHQFHSHMLKEIYEQPNSVLHTALAANSTGLGDGLLDCMDAISDVLPEIDRILIAASGTSRHAGLAGKYMTESLCRIPVEVVYASEFQYSPAYTGPNTLVLVITQSGETADTLAALRKAKATGSRVVAISNVSDSSVMREADACIPTKAGPELAIPSTKTFTSQLAALYLFALWLAEQTGCISSGQTKARIADLMAIPEKLDAVLKLNSRCREVGHAYFARENFFFAGRGAHYPVALDGALKLNEVSYVHAQGYPLGEIMHGPIASIDEDAVAVILATRDPSDPESVVRYEKTLSHALGIRERSSKIIAVANEEDRLLEEIADEVLYIPPASDLLLPILEIVPLQLLAYHIAVLRGNDVDHPRHLVKSVRTE